MFCSNCGTQLSDNTRFCGKCAYPAKGTEKLKGIGKPENITGLWLNYVAMHSHFRFYLREKNGAVLFSYKYLKTGCGFVEQEDLPVDFAYMQELREFIKENDYVHLTDRDPSKRKIFVADLPSCHLELKWADYKPLLIRSVHLPPNGDKLKEFFIGIAENINQNVF